MLPVAMTKDDFLVSPTRACDDVVTLFHRTNVRTRVGPATTIVRATVGRTAISK
jgi:hypothetical protein